MKPNVVLAILIGALEFATVVRANGTEHPVVAVCVDGEVDQYAQNVARYAQLEASTIFRSIGVQLDWHRTKSDFCVQNGDSVTRITYSLQAPTNLSSSALASARPYEGVHIEVFYNRMPGGDDAERAKVLGYVLVHEITHILQGVARHSDSGIMKAQWDKADFVRMRLAGLPFADGDVDLIQKGLRVRGAPAAPGTFVALSSSSRPGAGSSNIEKPFQHR